MQRNHPNVFRGRSYCMNEVLCRHGIERTVAFMHGIIRFITRLLRVDCFAQPRRKGHHWFPVMGRKLQPLPIFNEMHRVKSIKFQVLMDKYLGTYSEVIGDVDSNGVPLRV